MGSLILLQFLSPRCRPFATLKILFILHCMTSNSQKNPINFKDPFTIWGFALIVIGVGFGGMIGGGMGAGAGAYILQMEKKGFGNSKKIAHSLAATVLAAMGYLLLATLVSIAFN
jgi:hypothetical protein